MKKIFIIITILVFLIGCTVQETSNQNIIKKQNMNSTAAISKCGDGICDSKEKQKNVCPEDCGGITPSVKDEPIENQLLSPFGIMAAFEPSTLLDIDTPDKIAWAGSNFRNLGAKWSREAGERIIWELIEPTLGTGYDFADSDEILKNVYAQGGTGFNMVVVISPSRGKGVSDDILPANEQYFKNFVKAVVERYDGDRIDDASGNIKVKYWQADNEPFPMKWEDGGGTIDGYVRFVELFNEAVKEADPTAKIILGTFSFDSAGIADLNRVIPKMKDKDLFDYVDTHNWGKPDNYKISITEAKSILDSNGYSNAKLVSLEFGTAAERLGVTQEQQANYLIKGYVYNLAQGFVLINWNNLVEWSAYGWPQKAADSVYNFMGLIADGQNGDSESAGTPRLSYYTYKLMVEKLEGIDWDNTDESYFDGIYLYGFTKNEKQTWVAWNDNSAEKDITLSKLDSTSIKITEAVPKYENGKDVTDYSTAFNSEIKSVSNGQVSLTLGDNPVFVEELN